LILQEEDFEEDEGIYEDLHLDEEEDAVGSMQDQEDTLSESDMQSVSEGSSSLVPYDSQFVLTTWALLQTCVLLPALA
jgi:hypothetical protein